MMDYKSAKKTPMEEKLIRDRELAWMEYINVRNRADEEFDEMKRLQKTYERLQSAAKKEEAKKAEVIQRSKIIWQDYNAFLDYYYAKIRELRRSAYMEYGRMKEYYMKTDTAMERGDMAKASMYQKKGRSHEENYENIKASIHDLTMEIQHERDRVDKKTPAYDDAMLNAVDADIELTKKKYEVARSKYERLKRECEDLRMEYYRAADEYESYITSLEQ